MKYVSPLTEDETVRLNDIVKNGPCSRGRHRAHYILLSSDGYTINETADIFKVERRAVSSRIDAWTEFSFDGQPSERQAGKTYRRREKKAVEPLRENPRSVKTVIAEPAVITGETVSADTLKRLTVSVDLIWWRVRKSVKAKRDEDEFAKAENEIEELKKRLICDWNCHNFRH
ncbi:hypothetical protein QUF90_25460 [Desulfococcaceae bacterium HSG9]|nr:hypothetical protein [Desulfococcaceae bacterium HSG9]